jgi:hypothetical protein
MFLTSQFFKDAFILFATMFTIWLATSGRYRRQTDDQRQLRTKPRAKNKKSPKVFWGFVGV